jgi:hypothetical protein
MSARQSKRSGTSWTSSGTKARVRRLAPPPPPLVAARSACRRSRRRARPGDLIAPASGRITRHPRLLGRPAVVEHGQALGIEALGSALDCQVLHLPVAPAASTGTRPSSASSSRGGTAGVSATIGCGRRSGSWTFRFSSRAAGNEGVGATASGEPSSEQRTAAISPARLSQLRPSNELQRPRPAAARPWLKSP